MTADGSTGLKLRACKKMASILCQLGCYIEVMKFLYKQTLISVVNLHTALHLKWYSTSSFIKKQQWHNNNKCQWPFTDQYGALVSPDQILYMFQEYWGDSCSSGWKGQDKLWRWWDSGSDSWGHSGLTKHEEIDRQRPWCSVASSAYIFVY